jgi:CheY-like chemotaxis protein
MQIYAGGFLVLPHAVNLSREVQKLQAEMNAMLPDTVVTNYDLASDMAEVRGDPNLLREILRNLMLNAKDAIMAVGLHGTITVRTATITLSPPDRAGAVEGSCELKPGDCAVLEVADTGCGMNSDTRARIFDPFFSTKFIGRGIGLPVVLGIVREMQGAIYVTSSVGKGTTIRVVFPIAAPAGAPAPQPKPAHLAIRPQATILVADDEPDILCVTRQGLQSAGFKVLTAADGEAAVELFRRNVSDVSLVLLDLSMPKMDGVAAFRRIRDLRADVPVIIVSGYGEQVVRDRFGDTPPSDFLQKPYTALDLGQRLRTFVLSAASAGPAATFSTSVQASS